MGVGELDLPGRRAVEVERRKKPTASISWLVTGAPPRSSHPTSALYV
jgi:hypothetical protein